MRRYTTEEKQFFRILLDRGAVGERGLLTHDLERTGILKSTHNYRTGGPEYRFTEKGRTTAIRALGLKPRWVKGRGADKIQGNFKLFKKKGQSYYKEASWPFLKKNAEKLQIVVSWSPGGRGDWQRQTFTPEDLKHAKHFARVTAEEGWDAYVFAEAWTTDFSGRSMGMNRVYDFGAYEVR